MINRDKRIKDSSRGLGSMMMASDPEEMKVPTDMIDDPGGTFQTDETEAIMQIMESGQLTQIKESIDPSTLSDIMSMYDSAVEDGRFMGSFDEFLATILVQEAKKNSSGMDQGIMSTMRG
jgi:hypothetical protein